MNFDFLERIPKHLRGWFYLITATVMFLTIVALLIVEVWQNGNAGEWLKWLVALFGLGSAGMAYKNTGREKEFPPRDSEDNPEADLP